MSARFTNYKDVIDHLPPASVLVLEDVTWEEYESLLEDLAEHRRSVRVTYDRGRLELVTTSRKHEKFNRFIEGMIRILSEEYAMNIESSGQATWKRKHLAKGAESDSAFHIAAAGDVIGKEELNLDHDPPPDLAIEIDVSNQSLGKLPIYSAFSVPEIWRYLPRKNVLQIYVLRESAYIDAESSRAFPILTRIGRVPAEKCKARPNTGARRFSAIAAPATQVRMKG